MKAGRARVYARIGLVVLVLSALAFATSFAGRSAQNAAAPSNGDQAAAAKPAPVALADAFNSPGFQSLATAMYPEMLDKLPPIYQEVFIARLAAEMDPNSGPLPQICMAPDTPQEIVDLFTFGSSFDGRYNQTNRWSSTANGSTGSQGDPITLTYGFPPDGTTIPVGSGFASGPNQLNAWMNSLYGSQANWKPLFDQVFARWSQLCGVTYVYEPNDDGVTMNQNPGVLGVRADLRIGAKSLDGNSNVLAYNNFPNDGDMVLDAFDSFFNSTASNSRRLRNVVAHEHGHGMGQLHVCPINETKLMEPFVSTIYDGPRHDDVRNVQRMYGDPFEPNNLASLATDLGAFTIGSSQNIGLVPSPSISSTAILSIDANGDADYYKFTIPGPASLTVTVTPQGLTYDDSDQSCSGQSGSCCSGNNTNSLAIANLAFDVYGTNGFNLLATRDALPAGSAETLAGINLPAAGTYFVRVDESDNPSESQLYRLTITLGQPTFQPPSITFPNGAPTVLVGGEATTFDVVITPNNDTIVSESELLQYRYAGGAFTGVPLNHISGNNYQATLPAAVCEDVPEFYLSVVGVTSGLITNPTGGGASPLTADVIPYVLDDNFQTDMGWTVATTATGGGWERGVPVNFDRGDPPADYDGSGSCYLTENNALTDNSDVDDGETVLTSPSFATDTGDQVSYAYWLNDFPNGLLQGGDSLRVEVATDAAGTNWNSVRNYTTAAAQWRTDSLVAGVDFTASATTRVRFTANDIGTQNVVEAGIDAFLADGCLSEPLEIPAAPTGVAASDGDSCELISITWSASVGATDYELWRSSTNDSNTASLIASSLVATSFPDASIPGGVTQYYWVKACNASGCSPFSTADSGFRLALPGTPTGIVATQETVCGAIDVSWNDVPEATIFHIWRNIVDDYASSGFVATTNQLAVRDASVDPDLQYFYWVDAEGECGWSAEGASAMGSAAPKGDFNLDGQVDGADLQGFVEAMLGDAFTLECADFAAPFGVLTGSDTQEMVNLLVNP